VISLSSSLFDLTSLWSVASDLRKDLKDGHTAYVVDVDAVISQLGSGNLGLANQVVRWMLPSLTSLFFPKLGDNFQGGVGTCLSYLVHGLNSVQFSKQNVNLRRNRIRLQRITGERAKLDGGFKKKHRTLLRN